MKDAQQDPCAHCEEMMQPYLDHILTEAERVEAEHASRRLRMVPAPLPLRGEPARLRAASGQRADAERAQGEARRAAHPAELEVRESAKRCSSSRPTCEGATPGAWPSQRTSRKAKRCECAGAAKRRQVTQLPGPRFGADDHDAAARVGAAGQRLHRHPELLREPRADGLAARRVVDGRLEVVEARRAPDVRDAVRERLHAARDRARVDDVAAPVQDDDLDRPRRRQRARARCGRRLRLRAALAEHDGEDRRRDDGERTPRAR